MEASFLLLMRRTSSLDRVFCGACLDFKRDLCIYGSGSFAVWQLITLKAAGNGTRNAVAMHLLMKRVI